MSFNFIPTLHQRYCATKHCLDEIESIKEQVLNCLKGLNFELTNSVTTLSERIEIRQHKEMYMGLLAECSMLEQKCKHIMCLKDLEMQSQIWDTCSKWIYDRMT